MNATDLRVQHKVDCPVAVLAQTGFEESFVGDMYTTNIADIHHARYIRVLLNAISIALVQPKISSNSFTRHEHPF